MSFKAHQQHIIYRTGRERDITSLACRQRVGSLASVAIFSALSSTLCELQLDFRFVRNGDNLRGMLASANVSLSRPLRSVGVWACGWTGRRLVGRDESVAWRRCGGAWVGTSEWRGGGAIDVPRRDTHALCFGSVGRKERE